MGHLLIKKTGTSKEALKVNSANMGLSRLRRVTSYAGGSQSMVNANILSLIKLEVWLVPTLITTAYTFSL